MATLCGERLWEVPSVVLRASDEAECRLGGNTGQQAVEQSVFNSTSAFALWIGGELVAVWGYRAETILGLRADTWLLTTEAIDKHPLAFGRWSRRTFAYLQSLYPTLTAIVDPAHTAAYRWLTWLGYNPVGMFGPHILMSTGAREWAN